MAILNKASDYRAKRGDLIFPEAYTTKYDTLWVTPHLIWIAKHKPILLLSNCEQGNLYCQFRSVSIGTMGSVLFPTNKSEFPGLILEFCSPQTYM